MATKNYYPQCKKILDEIEKKFGSDGTKDWTHLLNEFIETKKGDDEKREREKFFKAKQRIEKDKKCSYLYFKRFKELYQFMRKKLNEYIPLDNKEFEEKNLGKDVVEQIENWAAEMKNT